MNLKSNKKPNTSWNKAADWYDELLATDPDSYQCKVILPNILRLMDIKRGEQIADIACGQGYFTEAFYKQSGSVVGVDIASKLIQLASKHSPKIQYHVASAESMPFLASNSFDKVAIILALQNMVDVNGVIKEAHRILKSKGSLYIVLNHPAFRVLKESSWGWDEKMKAQYRRIDRYISEAQVKIQMHPGDNPKDITLSFHRPFQFYFKIFHKNGLAVTRLEEWISHRTSERGPRAIAEDRARKEIPLFLAIETIKL
ncbi:MAG TPA: methyltransferase domain-containing protein [Candidatus Paceibacterota bacterium]